MSKNILVFSDGTGQAGGLRPDENRSNIYVPPRAGHQEGRSLHTGEVQGSIPCASTRKDLIYKAFKTSPRNLIGSIAQNDTQTCRQGP